MKDVYIARGAVVTGNVKIGEQSSVWYNAVVRNETDSIVIGKRVNLQDGVILHNSVGFPIVIGDGVTVGHGAIVHGAQIGENTLIGMGAILLNGSRIGRDSIVAAGSLVTQNRSYPDGVLIIGNPARVFRKLTEEEIETNRQSADIYTERAKNMVQGGYIDIRWNEE